VAVVLVVLTRHLPGARSGQQLRWSVCSLHGMMQESCQCEPVIKDLFLMHYF